MVGGDERGGIGIGIEGDRPGGLSHWECSEMGLGSFGISTVGGKMRVRRKRRSAFWSKYDAALAVLAFDDWVLLSEDMYLPILSYYGWNE
jgi:hypothetical protein